MINVAHSLQTDCLYTVFFVAFDSNIYSKLQAFTLLYEFELSGACHHITRQSPLRME